MTNNNIDICFPWLEPEIFDYACGYLPKILYDGSQMRKNQRKILEEYKRHVENYNYHTNASKIDFLKKLKSLQDEIYESKIFFGYDDISSKIDAVMDLHECFILTGPNGIGKTFFSHKVENTLKNLNINCSRIDFLEINLNNFNIKDLEFQKNIDILFFDHIEELSDKDIMCVIDKINTISINTRIFFCVDEHVSLRIFKNLQRKYFYFSFAGIDGWGAREILIENGKLSTSSLDLLFRTNEPLLIKAIYNIISDDSQRIILNKEPRKIITQITGVFESYFKLRFSKYKKDHKISTIKFTEKHAWILFKNLLNHKLDQKHFSEKITKPLTKYPSSYLNLSEEDKKFFNSFLTKIKLIRITEEGNILIIDNIFTRTLSIRYFFQYLRSKESKSSNKSIYQSTNSNELHICNIINKISLLRENFRVPDEIIYAIFDLIYDKQNSKTSLITIKRILFDSKIIDDFSISRFIEKVTLLIDNETKESFFEVFRNEIKKLLNNPKECLRKYSLINSHILNSKNILFDYYICDEKRSFLLTKSIGHYGYETLLSELDKINSSKNLNSEYIENLFYFSLIVSSSAYIPARALSIKVISQLLKIYDSFLDKALIAFENAKDIYVKESIITSISKINLTSKSKIKKRLLTSLKIENILSVTLVNKIFEVCEVRTNYIGYKLNKCLEDKNLSIIYDDEFMKWLANTIFDYFPRYFPIFCINLKFYFNHTFIKFNGELKSFKGNISDFVKIDTQYYIRISLSYITQLYGFHFETFYGFANDDEALYSPLFKYLDIAISATYAFLMTRYFCTESNCDRTLSLSELEIFKDYPNRLNFSDCIRQSFN